MHVKVKERFRRSRVELVKQKGEDIPDSMKQRQKFKRKHTATREELVPSPSKRPTANHRSPKKVTPEVNRQQTSTLGLDLI